MKAKITGRTLTSKPPASGQLEIWDTVLQGFGLRISYGGRKTFFIMVRINGRQRRLKVGNAAVMKLSEARDKARDMLRDAEKGIDPAARERIDRREAQKATQNTFAGVAKMYMAERGSKRADATERQRKLDVDILPALGHLPIAEITRTDIKELLIEKAKTSPIAANRLHALISTIFTYALDEEMIETVPNLRNLKQDETPRDRVLTDTELRYVWRGAERMGWPYGHVVRFMMLTAQRRGECAGITRGELSEAGWSLPDARSKNGQGHLVPLSTAAREIVDDCPQIDGTDLIFTATRRYMKDGEDVVDRLAKPVAGWSDLKGKLDALILDIRRDDAERAGADPETVKPLPAWTPHDLRRTAATGMQSLGFSDDVIDKVLNHKLRGVRKAYNRFARNPEKQRALDAWAAHVEAVVSGRTQPENVVTLREHA